MCFPGDMFPRLALLASYSLHSFTSIYVRLAALYQLQPIAIVSYNHISAFNCLPMPATAKDDTEIIMQEGHGFSRVCSEKNAHECIQIEV